MSRTFFFLLRRTSRKQNTKPNMTGKTWRSPQATDTEEKTGVLSFGEVFLVFILPGGKYRHNIGVSDCVCA